MIVMDVVGADAVIARFRTEIRAFQREQRKQMLLAANVVKKDVIAKVEQIFPTSTGQHKRGGATLLGPLRKKIGVRILNTKGDVVALIRPKASAFYGRFQETGLPRAGRGRGFMLRRKPFLEPVAEADAGKVADILGDAYGVFYRGGA
jgi:hypothetical protein